MKFTYLLSVLLLLFTSCPKEIIEPIGQSPKFICTVGEVSFADDNPQIDINNSDMMSISLSDGAYDIDLRIYNFSSINENEIVYFSVPSMGLVNNNGITYSSFYQPPYDGELIFTKKEAEKLSGTFHFKAQDVAVGSFLNIAVKDGVFEDVMY